MALVQRVQIPAYTDRWMMGDRYGEVVKVTTKRANALGEGGKQIAHLDKSRLIRTFYLDDCQEV